MKKTLVIILIAVFVIVLAFVLYGSYEAVAPELEEEWVLYENEQFGFSLRHPSDWRVSEFPDQLFSPTFNVHPESVDVNFALTHHHDVPHVSVFPHGVPTEGVFGEQVPTEVSFAYPFRDSLDYILEDGSRWATFASFFDTPNSWQESGFLWANAGIDNLSVRCERGGDVVPEEKCDPFTGDKIVRSGSVPQEMRVTQIKILESFRFIDLPDSDTTEVIRIFEPTEGGVIKSPLTVRGEARGTWYFEASFPIVIVNWDGLIIAQGFAEAQGDWMTQRFVPFEGIITFKKPDISISNRGAVIFQKDNPSGLPEHDDAVEVSVIFE